MSVEVKPGYKLTEVGVIPEDWDVKPLKGRVSIAHGFAFASQYFAGSGGFRLTTPGHFYEEGGFRDIGEKQKFYTGPVPADYVLRPGDLIVAMTEQADGLLGSAAFIPNVTGYLHNQRLGRVQALTTEVSLDYLFWVFNSASYRAKVHETAAGTKVKHTSPEKLLEIPVRLPPEPEQHAIATALSEVDALLGGLDRLIAKKRDLKQAAMQQLLTGQTRLPGFHGEWEVRKLSEHFKIYAGGDVPKHSLSQTQSASYPYPIFANAIQDKGLYGYTNERRSKADSLTITARGYLGHAEYRDEPFFPIVRLLVLEPIGQLDARFTSYAVNDRVEFAIESTGVPQLTAPQVGKYSVTAPPSLPEQTAIAAVLSDIDAELAALEARRDKTRALKQAMMQELLTGRTRLVSRGDAKNAEERE